MAACSCQGCCWLLGVARAGCFQYKPADRVLPAYTRRGAVRADACGGPCLWVYGACCCHTG